LEIGRGKETPFETAEPATVAEFEWLSHLAEPVRKILEAERRPSLNLTARAPNIHRKNFVNGSETARKIVVSKNSNER
jgi:hypothetical protein